MLYAPVVIPTLCRYEHFKACLESLSLCTGAENTDVYIGLDFPAKESHWEGYNKISKYLNEMTFNFKTLNVIKRERNYGVGPNGNYALLRKDIFERYDRMIFSEDDNIFSPNFLEYMNKGLEKFKEDDSIFAICGYKPFYPTKFENNTFSRRNDWFFAWGYGIWKDRQESIPDRNKYFKNNFSVRNLFLIKKEIGAELASCYFSAFSGFYRSWSDIPLCLYAFLEKKNFIYPSEKSLVRNMGWDQTGLHCDAPRELCDKFSEQEISTQKEFEFIGTGYEFYQDNRKIAVKYSYARISEITFWKNICKGLVKYFLGIHK